MAKGNGIDLEKFSMKKEKVRKSELTREKQRLLWEVKILGNYLNPGNKLFKMALESEIYVDKTKLLSHTNRVVCTEQRYICVSRPRRFGKSMAVNMLTAYYSKGCDSRELFAEKKIAKCESYEEHRNKYNVLYLNMQEL